MNTPESVPLWVEIVTAVLLLASAVFAVVAAWGLVRLKDFFQRMHPPALVSTWGAWCVTLASIVHFSARGGTLALQAWLIIIVLSITVPITTLMLSRAALFRARRKPSGESLPAPLHPEHTIESAGPTDTRAG